MNGRFLERMAESSRLRSKKARERLSPEALKSQVDALPPSPSLVFSRQGFDLIAEIKPRSPSEGRLARGEFPAGAIAREYVAGGAMALSVLTEPSHFDGSLKLLADVAAAVPDTPVMRKDFLVDPYQVLEARRNGAAGVLLIVGMVDDDDTEAMLATALELGMFALLEAFDEEELQRAQRIAERLEAPPGSALLGMNCRDLRTLTVDRNRFFRLAPRSRGGYRLYAESGVEDARQAAELASRGWDGWLMGTALMRAHDPRALAANMLAEARRNRSGS